MLRAGPAAALQGRGPAPHANTVPNSLPTLDRHNVDRLFYTCSELLRVAILPFYCWISNAGITGGRLPITNHRAMDEASHGPTRHMHIGSAAGPAGAMAAAQHRKRRRTGTAWSRTTISAARCLTSGWVCVRQVHAASVCPCAERSVQRAVSAVWACVCVCVCVCVYATSLALLKSEYKRVGDLWFL
jgi:hypothetical protein